jgi:PAS domain S-box-containing protein
MPRCRTDRERYPTPPIPASPRFAATGKGELLSRANCGSLVALVWSGLLLAIVPAWVALAAQAPGTSPPIKRIVIFFSDEPTLPGNPLIDRGLRAGFAKDLSFRTEFFQEYLDLSRFGGEAYEQRLAGALSQKYGGRQPDLLIAIAPLATLFAARWGPIVFPGVPIVYLCPSWATVSALASGPNATGVLGAFDVRGTMEAALRLRPQTRRVVVVSGATRSDHEYVELIRAGLVGIDRQVSVEYLLGLPMSELLARVAGLPHDTVILYVSIFRDGSGQDFQPPDALEMVSARSVVPVFGPVGTYLGRGIVGGHLLSWEEAGVRTAELALRVLHGAHPRDVPPSSENLCSWMFDARQLKRWGIRESALPAGSQVLFRPLSLWRQHPWGVLGTILFILFETALVVVLVFERRQRQQAQSQERLFSAIVASSNDAVIGIDAEKHIVTWNRGAQKVFGYAPEEAIGRSVEILVPPERQQEATSAFEVTIAGREVAPFETVRLRKDGSPVHVSINDSPIYDRKGRIIGISSTQRDITEHRHAELETQRLNQELSHVARVTMMGELTSSLAHELNQPLTAILSNAQAAQRLLGDGEPDLEELREILADIVADDDRAGEIIQRLRTLLRKGELEFRDLDVNALVLDVVRLVRSDAIIKSISVTVDLAPDLPRVRADRVQIQQVILNLMINAIDAVMSRPAVGRKLLIRTGAGTDGAVNVAVRDSGPGIPPDKLERVFEPFFTTKANGMGMGLAIARSILHSHGGRLWAENAPGGGAAFTLALPGGAVRQ